MMLILAWIVVGLAAVILLASLVMLMWSAGRRRSLGVFIGPLVLVGGFLGVLLWALYRTGLLVE